MQISVGIISAHKYESTSAAFKLINFTIHPTKVDETTLPDSAHSSPGRYISECFYRLKKHSPSEYGYLVVNPRFNLVDIQLGALLFHFERYLNKKSQAPAVVIKDRFGRSVAYFLKEGVEPEDKLILSAISAIDPALDSEFLQTLFGWDCDTLSIKELFAGPSDSNGFLLGSLTKKACTLPANQAIQAMKNLSVAVPLKEKRRSIPQIAVCPYHAGDVLFASQAIGLTRTINKFVVLEPYAEIVRDVIPWVEVLAYSGEIPGRNGDAYRGEMDAPVEIVERLRMGGAAPGIFHLLRPYRDYVKSGHDLRSQFYFSVGASPESVSDFRTWVHADSPRLDAHFSKKKVILHFDGGWSLKGFPAESRQPLISRLIKLGYDPLILGEPEKKYDGCDTVPYRGLTEFKRLLDESAALIGIDSFPAHYSVHNGLPTLHLFASTHPRNSRYPDSKINLALHQDMPCVPCGRPKRCKLDSGLVCKAAPTVNQIIDSFEAIMKKAGILEPLNVTPANLLNSGPVEAIERPRPIILAPLPPLVKITAQFGAFKNMAVLGLLGSASRLAKRVLRATRKIYFQAFTQPQ